MRKNGPSFVAEFPLRTDTAVERALAVRMEAARHIYNTCLQESLKRLKLMRESKDWQRARAMPRHVGVDKDGKPIPNPERRDLFKSVTKRYCFTSAEIQKHAEQCRDACWIGDHLGSHDTQTTSLRAFNAVLQYAFGKRGMPRFKGRNRLHSVEGKAATKVIRYRDGVVHWGGLSIPVILDQRNNDGWQRKALAAKLKYVRIVRRRIRGRDRWYAQLVMHGLPPLKAKHVLGKGVVGMDVGPSTIATVSATYASLRQFCPTVDDISKELRPIERAMDRSRRATNPDNYNTDGTAKKGVRKWKYSRRYRQLRDELADAERRLASERKRSHGQDINRDLALGDVFKLEKVSYRAWQKRFGRSVKRRAPGMYVSQLRRKAGRAGALVVEIDTRKTRLSQFDHKTGEYRKKKLSERWHVFDDGSRVQRDLYSAWLARHVHENSLDASLPLLEESYLGAEPLLWQAASGLRQSAIGSGSSAPSERTSLDVVVRADRLPKAGGRRTGRCSKRTRPGIEAGQAVARGPHSRERSGEITLDTARIPAL